MKYKFKTEIEKIFGTLTHYNEMPDKHTIYFEVSGNEVHFSRLEALSLLLGTKNINFTGNREEYQLSEITWDSNSWAESSCVKM